MKTALISINAMGLGCPDCGEPLADPVTGSFMLTYESLVRLGLKARGTVTCASCGTKFRLPAILNALDA